MQIETENSKAQNLLTHMEDLRKVTLRSFWILLIGFLISWMYSNQIFDIIRQPVLDFLPNEGLIFTSPTEKFTSHIKASFLSGVLITAPLWLWQVWSFVAPGLYKTEKKYALLFILCGTFLFCAGVSFVYFIVYPKAFSFLFTFGSPTDTPFISIREYLSFFLITSLAFGMAFELPLALTLMALMGVVTSSLLKKFRRYAVLCIAIASAMLTPPDILSMIFLLVPLLGLYELSIFCVQLIERKTS